MIKKKFIKQCLAGFLSFAMTVTLFPAGMPETVQAADAPQPALHYDMSHAVRSEEHTSELQSLKGISDGVLGV